MKHAILLSNILLLAILCAAKPQNLVDLNSPDVLASIQKTDVQFQKKDGVLLVSTGHQQAWPGITIKAPDSRWDLTGVQTIVAELKNLSDVPVKIHLRVDNPGADGIKNCITNDITVDPGKIGTLRVALYDAPWALDKPLKLVGMRGYPKVSDAIDPANITQLVLFIARPDRDYNFELQHLTAEGDVKMLSADTFLPFIDRFGQFIHADWPGKMSCRR